MYLKGNWIIIKTIHHATGAPEWSMPYRLQQDQETGMIDHTPDGMILPLMYFSEFVWVWPTPFDVLGMKMPTSEIRHAKCEDFDRSIKDIQKRIDTDEYIKNLMFIGKQSLGAGK